MSEILNDLVPWEHEWHGARTKPATLGQLAVIETFGTKQSAPFARIIEIVKGLFVDDQPVEEWDMDDLELFIGDYSRYLGQHTKKKMERRKPAGMTKAAGSGS